MPELKTCTGCGQMKSVTEFWWAKGRPRSKCKVCFKAVCAPSLRRWRAEHHEEEVEKWRERAARDKAAGRSRGREYYYAHLEAQRRYAREHHREHPVETHARNLLTRALTSGWLVRTAACESCGKGPTEGHHEDYSKPLDVLWLCSSCHKRLHAVVTRG